MFRSFIIFAGLILALGLAGCPQQADEPAGEAEVTEEVVETAPADDGSADAPADSDSGEADAPADDSGSDSDDGDDAGDGPDDGDAGQ